MMILTELGSEVRMAIPKILVFYAEKKEGVLILGTSVTCGIPHPKTGTPTVYTVKEGVVEIVDLSGGSMVLLNDRESKFPIGLRTNAILFAHANSDKTLGSSILTNLSTEKGLLILRVSESVEEIASKVAAARQLVVALDRSAATYTRH